MPLFFMIVCLRYINKVVWQKMNLAGIQSNGLPGITEECLNAIKRLITFGDKIYNARLLTHRDGDTAQHAFLLEVNQGELIAIKSGFASGYAGTGSHGLADALRILLSHKTNVEEFNVSQEFIERLDGSALLTSDIEELDNRPSVRPTKYHDYIIDLLPEAVTKTRGCANIYYDFPPVVPYALIDERLLDLVMGFLDAPDAKLLSAYRRLEDIIKERTEIKGKSGQKLMSGAFHGDESILHWEDEDKGEHASKANLFSAVYGAYRNPRAHKEGADTEHKCIRELMLVNELYLLERFAVKRIQVNNTTIRASDHKR